MIPEEFFKDHEHAYDFNEAFTVLGGTDWTEGDEKQGKADPFRPEDVAEIYGHNIAFGDYAETTVWLYGRLKNGLFFYLDASCDTTGWDCQAGGRAYVSTTRERLVQMAIGIDERKQLGIICGVHADCIEHPELAAACAASQHKGDERP